MPKVWIHMVNVVSFFAGAGGSSTGYKQAGMQVLLAVDWEKRAVATYKMNYPDSAVWQKDIRTITGTQVLEYINLKKGELDILDGSPPCTPFSIAGQRECGWGKTYVHTADSHAQCTSDLFLEFIRICDEIRPKVIIAENVKGLIIGQQAKRFFNHILQQYRNIGYKPRAYLVNAADFGVPQSRERIIIIAVRSDYYDCKQPITPLKKTVKQHITLRQAFRTVHNTKEDLQAAQLGKNTRMREYLPRMRPGEQRAQITGNSYTHRRHMMDRPAFTLLAHLHNSFHPIENRHMTIPELCKISTFPDGYKFLSRHDAILRMGNAVPPKLIQEIAKYVQKEIL